MYYYALVDRAPDVHVYCSWFMCLSVYVCVCVTRQLRFLEAHDKLSTDMCNIGIT